MPGAKSGAEVFPHSACAVARATVGRSPSGAQPTITRKSRWEAAKAASAATRRSCAFSASTSKILALRSSHASLRQRCNRWSVSPRSRVP